MPTPTVTYLHLHSQG